VRWFVQWGHGFDAGEYFVRSIVLASRHLARLAEDDDVGDAGGFQAAHLTLVALVPDLEVCVSERRGYMDRSVSGVDLGRESEIGEKAGRDGDIIIHR
jgi:hypothetical protein